MEDLTIRCGMYKNGKLVEYYDFEVEGMERNFRWFEGAVYDEGADQVRIVLYNNDKRVTSWVSPVDRDFNAFVENVVEQIEEERLMCELEKNDLI